MSEGARGLLKGGKDLHKAADWILRVCYPCMLITFQRVYREQLPAGTAYTHAGFMAWVRADHNDKTFEAQVWFYLFFMCFYF